jgi:predicted dehydrogenase
MANARLMIAAAEKADRVYAVIQNRRYDAGIQAVRAALESGVIGRVHTIHGEFFLGAHFGGFRAAMQHALILDMAIHTFDQARFLSRTDPRAVYCREWNPPGSWFAHGASASAIFDMTGDLVFTYNGCWCAEGYRTNWNSNWLIIGDNGTLRWNGASEVQIQQPGEPEGLTRRPVDVPLEVGVLDKAQRAHRGLISEFIQCVRNGEIPETICTDNIKSLAMVFGAIESAECGNKVAIGA